MAWTSPPLVVCLLFGLSAAWQLPFKGDKTGTCPSKCVDRSCKSIALYGQYNSFDVFGDCTHTCQSMMWETYGYGQCWRTGEKKTCGTGESDVCRCQKVIKTTDCIEEGKAVDGQWSGWSRWSDCTKACGGGTHSRWRQCSNPAPKYGGKFCSGFSREDGDCNKMVCPPCRANEPTDCPKWIPKYDTAGEGFNIMTLKNMISNVIDVKQFGRCQRHTETLECLRVPSTVEAWKYRPLCYQDLTDETYTSVRQLNQMQEDYVSDSWKVGLDGKVSVPLFGGLFDFSAEASAAGSNSDLSNWARQQAESSSTQYQNLELNCQLYELSLVTGNIALNKQFANSIKQLPTNLTVQSVRDYMQFINTYGTHYFDKLKLGGRVKSLTAIVQSDLSEYSMTSSEVSKCLSLEAKARIGFSLVDLVDISGGVSGEYNSCTRESSSTSQSMYTSQFMSRRRVEVRGGTLSTQRDLLFSPSTMVNYKLWMSEIRYFPDVFKYNTVPMHSLLRKVHLEQQNKDRPMEFQDLSKKSENLRKITIMYIQGKTNETDCNFYDEKPNWCLVSSASSTYMYCSIMGLVLALMISVFIVEQ